MSNSVATAPSTGGAGARVFELASFWYACVQETGCEGNALSVCAMCIHETTFRKRNSGAVVYQLVWSERVVVC